MQSIRRRKPHDGAETKSSLSENPSPTQVAGPTTETAKEGVKGEGDKLPVKERKDKGKIKRRRKEPEISLVKYFGIFFTFVLVVMYLHFKHQVFGGFDGSVSSRKGLPKEFPSSIRVSPGKERPEKQQKRWRTPGEVVKKRKKEKLQRLKEEQQRRLEEQKRMEEQQKNSGNARAA